MCLLSLVFVTQRQRSLRTCNCGCSVPKKCLTGAVQALTPFTIGRSHAAASLLGALWGFGHSTGQLIMGLVMIILKVNPCMHVILLPNPSPSSAAS